MEETLKLLFSAAAIVIALGSLTFALRADVRSRKAEEVKNLLGEMESIAFAALKLLQKGLPPQGQHRRLVITAVMQACVFEKSDRARALLYRVIERNLAMHRSELEEALNTVAETFKSMDKYGFEERELNLERGTRRINTVRKVMGEPARRADIG